MPAVGTDLIYELLVTASIGSVSSTNVLYYWNDDPTPSSPASGELISEFTSEVLTPWAQLISAGCTLDFVSARRLNNISDFAVAAVGTAGVITGDRLPSFVAYQVKKLRTTKETRSGWMNVMGCVEADTLTSGRQLTTAALGRVQDLATAMTLTLTPTINSFRPVLVGNKRDFSVTPDVLNPEDEWVYQLVSSMVANTEVTSQVSRK